MCMWIPFFGCVENTDGSTDPDESSSLEPARWLEVNLLEPSVLFWRPGEEILPSLRGVDRPPRRGGSAPVGSVCGV